jgi:fatty-acid desaturase
MWLSIVTGILWYQVIAHVGISLGLHRYFSHKAFKAGYVFEIVVLYMSVLAGSRSPIGWIATHRMHHHHSDTDNDPHSPNTKGFWTVLFCLWKVESIPAKYSKDLFANPRIKFFHNYWKRIWAISAITALILSPTFFLSFIVIPALVAPIAFGMVNALTHYGGIHNVPWINILVGGEGYHKEHHNGKIVRFHKYDLTGYILEILLKWHIFKRT